MTLPTVVPAPFQGTSKDFLKAKFQADGTAFLANATTSVPSGTTATTVVGLVPVTAGARIVVGATKIVSAALGAGSTASVGIVYDDTVNNTSVPTLFASALTAVAAGGELVITPSVTNLAYVVTGNGWVCLTMGGTTTANTADVVAQVTIDYSA